MQNHLRKDGKCCQKPSKTDTTHLPPNPWGVGLLFFSNPTLSGHGITTPSTSQILRASRYHRLLAASEGGMVDVDVSWVGIPWKLTCPLLENHLCLIGNRSSTSGIFHCHVSFQWGVRLCGVCLLLLVRCLGDKESQRSLVFFSETGMRSCLF